MTLKVRECKMGLEVASNHNSLPVVRGVIAGPVSKVNGKDTVIVEWGGAYATLQRNLLNTLITKSEGDLLEARLTMEKTALEAEFETTCLQVAEKMKAAALLISEANQLVIKRRENLTSTIYHNEVSVLVDALGDAGWRTSSWGC